jgi:hypothetical protein
VHFLIVARDVNRVRPVAKLNQFAFICGHDGILSEAGNESKA